VIDLSKPYYVKIDMPQELVDASYEALRQAKQTGKIRKGTNSLQALSGTIRGDFGLGLTENVIHASDSSSSFDREKQILDAI